MKSKSLVQTERSSKCLKPETDGTVLTAAVCLIIPMEVRSLQGPYTKRKLSPMRVRQALERQLKEVPKPVYRYLAKWLEGRYTMDNLARIQVKTGQPSTSVDFKSEVDAFLDKIFRATPKSMTVGGKTYHA